MHISTVIGANISLTLLHHYLTGIFVYLFSTSKHLCIHSYESTILTKYFSPLSDWWIVRIFIQELVRISVWEHSQYAAQRKTFQEQLMTLHWNRYAIGVQHHTIRVSVHSLTLLLAERWCVTRAARSMVVSILCDMAGTSQKEEVAQVYWN